MQLPTVDLVLLQKLENIQLPSLTMLTGGEDRWMDASLTALKDVIIVPVASFGTLYPGFCLQSLGTDGQCR